MRFSSACRRTLLACSLLVAPILTVSSPARAQGVPIETATDAQKKEAQGLYERGAKAFDQKRYEDAFNAFASSYGVVRSPNAHMMMARALLGLGRFARAYNELAVVEEEGAGNPKYAPTVERSKELRAEAAQKVAVITIKLVGEKAGPVRVFIGDQLAPIDRAFAVEPGALAIKALVNEAQTDAKQVDVPAGQAQVVELKVGEVKPPPSATPAPTPTAPPAVPPPPVLPPKEEEPQRSPAASGLLISGTVVSLLGLGGMAVGAGFYFASKEDHDFLSDPEQSGCRSEGERTICPESLADRIESGQESQRNAQIAVAVGGGVTAIGVGLLIAGGVLTRGAPPEETASVRVLPGLGSLVVEGVF